VNWIELVVAVWAVAWIAGSALNAAAALNQGLARLHVQEALLDAAQTAAEQVTAGVLPARSITVRGVSCTIQVSNELAGTTPVVHIRAQSSGLSQELWLVSCTSASAG
jgi:hypothetical protein